MITPTTKSPQPDSYQAHRASCKECQKLSPCKVGHDLLLESVDWKENKKDA